MKPPPVVDFVILASFVVIWLVLIVDTTTRLFGWGALVGATIFSGYEILARFSARLVNKYKTKKTP